MSKESTRSKLATERLLNVAKSEPLAQSKQKDFIPNKKNITGLISKMGNSNRKADSIRINPILSSTLTYLTTIIEPTKSKPDIIEEALLKYLPEEYLIEGYKLAKKQNKI